jgi:hypothetical protein
MILFLINVFIHNAHENGYNKNDIVINYYDVDEIDEQNIENSPVDNDLDFDFYAERDAGQSKSIADIRAQNIITT